LIVITNNKSVLNFVNKRKINTSQKDCWDLLKEQQRLDAHKLMLDDFRIYCEQVQAATNVNFSYLQLRDMFSKLKLENFSNPFKPFFRLQPDYKLDVAKKIWQSKKHSKKTFADISEKRHNKIMTQLGSSPYLFIAGSSGVGKSTHILTRLRKEPNTQVYVGIENIKKWLTADDSKENILFIDEANLEQEGAWDLLEGLFNKTPGVPLEGKFYTISNKHKVIFAGNFNYFAGRYQHKFFERHGQVFNFKELPAAYLLSNIIQPALKSVVPDMSSDDYNEMADIFLRIYDITNKLLPEHPLTPRNLKMMCMRLSLCLKQKTNILNEQYSIAALAHKVAMDEVGGLINKDDFTVSEDPLVKQYQNINAVLNQQLPIQLGDYIVTDSRKNALRLLHDQFAMREMKLNEPERYANFEVPGILIEGASGIGKSKLVIEHLRALGYKNGFDDNNQDADTTKLYYHITPTDPAKMEQILLKAFHEGAVVIIDELNSLPLERILNHVLSGVDLDGNEAKKKGFFMFATQNPVTFTGRQALSIALENRFRKIYLPEYPEHELKFIAQQMCPNSTEANKLVDEFITAKCYAEQNNKKPAPTARDLFNQLMMLTGRLQPKIIAVQTENLAPNIRGTKPNNNTGLQLKLDSSQTKVAMDNQNDIISNENIDYIIKLVQEYINKRQSFLRKLTEISPKLNSFKVMLASSFINVLKDNSQANLWFACNGLGMLNYVLEEISDENNLAYKNMPSSEIKKLFSYLISSWPEPIQAEAVKKCPECNAIINDIFAELNDFENRNENTGYGKAYKPLFSSELEHVVTQINEIIKPDEYIKNNKKRSIN
jgi:hypothetical protein